MTTDVKKIGEMVAAESTPVRTLIDEQKAAGPHTVTWDGRDGAGRGAAAGLYLYQLKAGDQVMNRKMTLLK